MEAYLKLMEILEEAEEDVRNNRIALMSETFDELRLMLEEMDKRIL